MADVLRAQLDSKRLSVNVHNRFAGRACVERGQLRRRKRVERINLLRRGVLDSDRRRQRAGGPDDVLRCGPLVDVPEIAPPSAARNLRPLRGSRNGKQRHRPVWRARL